MNKENDKNELKPTEAFEPTEEGFDPQKEKKAHIGWVIFFAVTLILIVACAIVIKSLS